MRVHTSGDVALPAPQDWQVSRAEHAAALAVTEPAGADRFAANVVVTVEDLSDDETLVQWAQRSVAVLAEQIARLRVIDLEDTTIDGRTARRVLAHYPLALHGGVVLEQWLVADRPHGRGIVVSCSAAALAYDDRADLFAEMAAGLRLGGDTR